MLNRVTFPVGVERLVIWDDPLTGDEMGVYSPYIMFCEHV